MPVKYRQRFELLVGGMSLVYRRPTCPIFFSVWNDDMETCFCLKWKHWHFPRMSFFLTVGSVVLTNFGVCFSMSPATSHAFKMAACRTQRIFSAWEVVKLVLQPGCDEEENVVGAFSNSDTELLDSDNDYILVHDDEWSDVCEFFFFFYLPGTPWITCQKKKKV